MAVAACGTSSDSSSGSGGSSGTLTGAGSTLVAPLMSKWQSDFLRQRGITVTYGAIGSGGGIDQITARTVDFGASDAPMTSDQLRAKGVSRSRGLSARCSRLQREGVANKLKLSGPVLADIYLGKVTTWNDPAIAKLNPGINLPSTKITPVYRSDGSGDTYAFTDYLSSVSPEFKSKVGVSHPGQVPDRHRRREERRRRGRALADRRRDRLPGDGLHRVQQPQLRACCRTRPASSRSPDMSQRSTRPPRR